MLASVLALAPDPASASPQSSDQVILLTGLDATASYLKPLQSYLTTHGFASGQVGIYQLTWLGNGDIHQRAMDFSAFVAKYFPTKRLMLVGHSEGGLVARDYVQTLGGSSVVDRVVTIGTPHYGTTTAAAGSQMAIGSSFLTNLDRGDVTPQNIGYWAFATNKDTIATPWTNQFLPRRSGTTSPDYTGILYDQQVTNTTVQDQCPNDAAGHLNEMSDLAVQSGVLQALNGQRSLTLSCG